MRDIAFDFRVGGGSSTEILWGTVTIVGAEQEANGTAWVVTSETTLKLVNGQATLTGALERPSDGSKGHYHVIVRDSLSQGAATYRKFLPSDTSPGAFNSLPDAWWQVSKGTFYSWTGEASNSTSTKRVDGVLTRTNLSRNPSFEAATLLNWTISGGGAGSAISTDWARTGTKSLKGVGSGAVSGDVRLAGGSATAFPLGIAAGKTYRVSAYTYCPVDINRNHRSRRILCFYSINGSTFTENFGIQGSNTSGVERVSQTFSIPVNATGAIIGVGFASALAGQVTYVDDVLIEETTVLGDYFDGNTK